jgi:hypothetical protein
MKQRWWCEAVRRDEGAFAILFAVTIVLMFAFAALALDLATFYQHKQQLENTNDAAALAGAQELPDPIAAQEAVRLSVLANDPGLPTPQAVFYCVVASKPSPTGPVEDATQIGVGKLCNPGGSGYAPPLCNDRMCAIPCIGNSEADPCKPNAIWVGQDTNMRFSFAPVIGIASGDTGVVASVACKGTCGQAGSNPMDVVVIADRTGSMNDTERNLEVTAIQNMLLSMEPSIQRVALATVGWSTASGTCRSAARGTDPSRTNGNASSWIPVALSSDFGGKAGLNTGSSLIRNLNCLDQSSRTWLATPMRVAARYLLGTETGITGGADLQPSATKAIIFETDGEPTEPSTFNSPLTADNALSSSANVAAAVDCGNHCIDTTVACSNFTNVVQAAKAAGILVAFIDFHTGSLTDACDLSALASIAPNTETPMHYLANNAAQLNGLYQTALNAISGSSRLIKLPASP